MKNKPVKRHLSLQPFSREHHQGLLLCWKIRQGFKKSVAAERIKHYTDWFWKEHLLAHFKAEELSIFPILPVENSLVQQALTEHRRLQQLFEDTADIVRSLQSIAKELDEHIRFEERVLFNEIQQVATPEQLQTLENHHHHNPEFFEDWPDPFWVL